MNRALIGKREADRRGEERSLLKNKNKKFQHVMVKKSLVFTIMLVLQSLEQMFPFMSYSELKSTVRVRFLLYQESERGISKYLTTLKSLGHHIHVQTAEKN